MSRLQHTARNLARRKNRIRKTVSGTSQRPRLVVFVSNQHVEAQIIDDTKGTTLAHSTTVGQKAASGTMTDKAAWVGNEIAKHAKQKKIKRVVLDRNGRLYHGRIKALADAAREGGLEL
ncbi:MAG: 50S ribosomal protein L18 [Candidatus Saccharibacteria bacterium]|nr:50S ribosomal protein L18 [Candidatus Saccharibacteria bacterium]MDZ7785659.1 50S ribosomal protein L18 [Candidatus Saccharibacteria bacterium]